MFIAGLFTGLKFFGTDAASAFFHAVTFAIDLAAFTNIVQFAIAKTNRARKGKPFCRKWGPVMCLVLATILADADLVVHIIQDAWGTSCENVADGSTIQIHSKDGQITPVDPKYSQYCWFPPTLAQWTWEGMFCTWLGYFFLFVGIFWVISFPQKMKAQWRSIRGARQARAAERFISTDRQAPLV